MKKLRRRRSFDRLADIAAVNCYLSSCWGSEKPTRKEVLRRIHYANSRRMPSARPVPTFKQPTDCKTGFYSVLRQIWLDSCSGRGITSKDLCLVLGVKTLSLTLWRLESAGLIEKQRSSCKPLKWKVTELGDAYLDTLRKEFVVE